MPKQDEPNKVIYSMVGVGKVHGTKQVLKDIYLGYFYGAKIGVIGLNGSGKSTRAKREPHPLPGAAGGLILSRPSHVRGSGVKWAVSRRRSRAG